MKLCFWLILLSLRALAAEYAVMIDAGSTGSRVFVYEYDMPKIKLLGKLQVQPGLAQFETKLSEIKSYLEPLLGFAKTKLPASTNTAQVSLTLQATGGVRALSSSKQEQVIDATQTVLNETGFKDPKAEVISGITEGIYQWISINYLRGTWEDPKKPSAGLVEMGGASLQVTFLKQEPLKPGSLERQLYSKTYDGFGETSAWNRLGSKACKNIPLEYEACRLSLDKNLKVIQRPKLQGEFYLVDNFEQLAAVLKLKKVSSTLLDELGPKTCQKSLRELKKELPKESEYYLLKICFDTAYMSVVLERIGFDRKQELVATKEIANTTLSWTLGSLVDRLSSQKP